MIETTEAIFCLRIVRKLILIRIFSNLSMFHFSMKCHEIWQNSTTALVLEEKWPSGKT